MSRDEDASVRGAPVDLARETDFTLGGASISPSLGEVTAAGQRIRLQPRVMQVLVALARAAGHVVSRDELLASCWGGLAIGDDAINRCIGRLRRLAGEETSGAFAIETLTRIGYRLTSADGGAERGRPAQSLDTRVSAAGVKASPLLAVLAFDNLCEDADMGWFTDGVSEEIQQTVAQAKGLRVIGRATSFQFRGPDKAAAHVAAALGVTHVLDGSVRRSGTIVRISAQLIECGAETTLWSERFDRDLSDVFALQDEIAGAVAAALRVAFAPQASADAVDPAAYDLYLTALKIRANVFLDDPGQLDAAIKLVEQSTALAPGFARAWLHLAQLSAAQLRVSPVQDSEPDQPFAVIRAKIVRAAENALRLDPGLGSAYQTLSEVEPFGAHLDREALHAKALAVSPNDPEVLFAATNFFSEVGRIRDALDCAKQAHDLDPAYSWAAAAYACMLDAQGRRQESRPLWERFRVLWPEAEVIAWNAVSCAANYADWPWFDALVKSVRQSGLYTPTVRGMVWFGHNLRNPDSNAIQAALDLAREQVARSGDASLELLTTLYRLGRRDEIFDLIDRASFAYVFDPQRGRSGGVTVATIFSAMHNTPMMRDSRFPRLCDRLALVDYWVKSDRWPDCADEGVLPYDFKAECRRLAGQAAGDT